MTPQTRTQALQTCQRSTLPWGNNASSHGALRRASAAAMRSPVAKLTNTAATSTQWRMTVGASLRAGGCVRLINVLRGSSIARVVGGSPIVTNYRALARGLPAFHHCVLAEETQRELFQPAIPWPT